MLGLKLIHVSKRGPRSPEVLSTKLTFFVFVDSLTGPSCTLLGQILFYSPVWRLQLNLEQCVEIVSIIVLFHIDFWSRSQNISSIDIHLQVLGARASVAMAHDKTSKNIPVSVPEGSTPWTWLSSNVARDLSRKMFLFDDVIMQCARHSTTVSCVSSIIQ